MTQQEDVASGAEKLVSLRNFTQNNAHLIKGFGTPLAIMAILAMVVLPIPAMVLDILVFVLYYTLARGYAGGCLYPTATGFRCLSNRSAYRHSTAA